MVSPLYRTSTYWCIIFFDKGISSICIKTCGYCKHIGLSTSRGTYFCYDRSCQCRNINSYFCTRAFTTAQGTSCIVFVAMSQGTSAIGQWSTSCRRSIPLDITIVRTKIGYSGCITEDLSSIHDRSIRVGDGDLSSIRGNVCTAIAVYHYIVIGSATGGHFYSRSGKRSGGLSCYLSTYGGIICRLIPLISESTGTFGHYVKSRWWRFILTVFHLCGT